jgi:DsbC/DsbD-like thiol-disulfide interchange protein
MKITKYVLLFSVLCSLAVAQSIPSSRPPAVTMQTPGTFTVPRGQPTKIALQFRIAPGFHINSHKPNSELLIPTALKLDMPTDIIAEKVTYPPGKDFTFSFDPTEKLNVYSGAFTVSAMLRPLSSVAPSAYTVRGQLKFQACDDRACYPPKNVPVEFEIKVVKGAKKAVHRSSPQSPHIHN